MLSDVDSSGVDNGPAREQFRVDLNGIVDVLSNYLYTSQGVYLRELIQNARDALAARTDFDHAFTGGRIDITPASHGEPMVVRDNGVGLTAAEVRELLATVGGSSKRHELEVARERFLGQFGIGLFSCFLVADRIEMRSRSARTPDASTIRWVGFGDGTYTLEEASEPLESPGSELRIQPRHGELGWCNEETARRLATTFAELIDIPVYVAGDLISQCTPPWDLSVEDQIKWCRTNFGFDAMGIVELTSSMLGIRGLAFVLPHTVPPGQRAGDRVYSRGMLVSENYTQLIPSWAHFSRAIVDAGKLPLTASRESLLETTSLDFARENLGMCLISELIRVQKINPEVYQDIIRLHSSGLKSLAMNAPAMRDLLASTLPFATTMGHVTMKHLQERGGQVPYVSNAQTYAALRDVALRAGALVIDGSDPSDPQLLEAISENTPNLNFVEVGAEHVVELAAPKPYADKAAATRLRDIATQALGNWNVEVQVACFEPSSRPAIWWADSGAQGEDSSEHVILNAENEGIVALLKTLDATTFPMIRATYVLSLLLAGHEPSLSDTHALSRALQDIARAHQV